MPSLTFKSFYPRWVGWNFLGLGMAGAILTVLEFSGLMGNGLYASVQSAPLIVLIYLLIAGLTAACVYLTQRQAMLPYLRRSLPYWGLAAALPIGVVLPNASDLLIAIAAAGVAGWLVLRQEFPRAARWLLWAALPAEALAVGASLIKQYLLGLMLGEWLNGISSARLLLILLGVNLLCILLVTLISGIGMQRMLASRRADEDQGRVERNGFWLLWVLAPLLVDFAIRMLTALGLFEALQSRLWINAGTLPSSSQVLFALLMALAQWLVLRRYHSRAAWWLLPTVTGYLLAAWLYNQLGNGFLLLYSQFAASSGSQLPAFFARVTLGVIQGLIVGLLQMLVLRLWAPGRSWRWPLVLMLAELIAPFAPIPMVRELISGWGLIQIAGGEPGKAAVIAPETAATDPAA